MGATDLCADRLKSRWSVVLPDPSPVQIAPRDCALSQSSTAVARTLGHTKLKLDGIAGALEHVIGAVLHTLGRYVELPEHYHWC